MNECVIYDFETLGQDQRKSVVTSLALLSFSEKRYVSNPYTYNELLENTKYIKFDVEEQVSVYKRTISKDTLAWWDQQGDQAKKQIVPNRALDQSINKLHQFLIDHIDLQSHRKSFTRGNTFDPIFLDSVLANCGKINPMHWGSIRDTRSMIEGMSFGFDLDNGFVPTGLENNFVKHDPRHDIVMDVMRMQVLAQAISK
jgi:hypothetical protein